MVFGIGKQDYALLDVFFIAEAFLLRLMASLMDVPW